MVRTLASQARGPGINPWVMQNFHFFFYQNNIFAYAKTIIYCLLMVQANVCITTLNISFTFINFFLLSARPNVKHLRTYFTIITCNNEASRVVFLRCASILESPRSLEPI